MFFNKFTWKWRKRPTLWILSGFALLMLLILITGQFESINTLFPAAQSSVKLDVHSDTHQKNKCSLPKCTAEEKQKHGDLFASFPPSWSGCYGDFYLMAFDNDNKAVYTLLDVGANKAYAAATWFAFFLPEADINQASLHRYLLTTGKLTYVCGSCDDCQDQPLKRNNTKQKVTLHIHAFEPQPDTVSVLNGVQRWMNTSEKGASTFDVYGMAVSNYVGKASFKKCNPGNEVCSLDITNTSPRENVQVDIITLDHFADQHNLSIIDILKIDTEGYDPFVFQGAQRLLKQHRIRLFIFEHLKIAAWLNTSLQIEVSKLAELGYACYMIGTNGVILVTNCWNNKFDIQHNNLLCVSSKDRQLLHRIDQLRLTGTVSGVCEKTVTR